MFIECFYFLKQNSGGRDSVCLVHLRFPSSWHGIWHLVGIQYISYAEVTVPVAGPPSSCACVQGTVRPSLPGPAPKEHRSAVSVWGVRWENKLGWKYLG